MLAITAFLINPTPEHRTWVTTTLAATLAALVHFRPNSVFVFVALLPLLLMRARTSRPAASSRQMAWAIAAFVMVLPLSLLHNVYYGEEFVPFTANAAINYAFSWTDAWGEFGFSQSIELIWTQLRSYMYWRVPHDPNFMFFFWGSQLVFLAAVAARVRRQLLRTPNSLVVALPAAYVLPMLKYQLTSYYPRMITTASLLCLVAGLLLWTDTTRRTSQRS